MPDEPGGEEKDCGGGEARAVPSKLAWHGSFRKPRGSMEDLEECSQRPQNPLKPGQRHFRRMALRFHRGMQGNVASGGM
jgi:hypothetical protein